MAVAASWQGYHAGICRAAALGLAAARSSIVFTVRGTSGGGGVKARTAMKVPSRLSTCSREGVGLATAGRWMAGVWAGADRMRGKVGGGIGAMGGM